MGFWDNDEMSVVSRRSHDGRTKYSVERSKKSPRSRSRSRSRAPTRGVSSIFGGGGGGKHSSSRSSFFSLPGGSRSSFFGLGEFPSSPSSPPSRRTSASTALLGVRAMRRHHNPSPYNPEN